MCSGYEVNTNGLAAHTRQLADIGQGSDAGHQRGEYQRNRNELEQVDENCTEGRNPVLAKTTLLISDGKNTEKSTAYQANDDLPMEFQFHCCFLSSVPFIQPAAVYRLNKGSGSGSINQSMCSKVK